MYLALSIKSIRLNQRQSNFIDSVTHELKSPLASLKLCLQTLDRRQLSAAAAVGLSPVHARRLAAVALLDRPLARCRPAGSEAGRSAAEDVELAALLERLRRSTCQRYRLPPETIRRELSPAWVRARPIDLEMVFRNLLDNAVKYAGDVPEVGDRFGGARRRPRDECGISDNGPGIPPPLRRKIFGRFVRVGNELERSKPGTGLGCTSCARWSDGCTGRSRPRPRHPSRHDLRSGPPAAARCRAEPAEDCPEVCEARPKQDDGTDRLSNLSPGANSRFATAVE